MITVIAVSIGFLCFLVGVAVGVEVAFLSIEKIIIEREQRE